MNFEVLPNVAIAVIFTKYYDQGDYDSISEKKFSKKHDILPKNEKLQSNKSVG